jgi:CRP-like cAMP-binding protein
VYQKSMGALSSSIHHTLPSRRRLRTRVSTETRAAAVAGRNLRGLAHDDSIIRSQQSLLILDGVRSSPLFAGLSADPQRELRDHAIERSFGSREFIFREDDPVRFVDVIGSGSVKITQLSREGAEVILRVACAGCPLDGMGDGAETVHTTTARAIRDCSILSWDASVFAKLVERFPLLQRNATAIVRRRLKMLEQSFCDISTAPAPQRLARILLRLTSYAPCNDSESLGLSREELAQMIGTSPFTISRLLREWAERQIVYVSRNGVVIDDLQTLVQLSEESDGEQNELPHIA